MATQIGADPALALAMRHRLVRPTLRAPAIGVFQFSQNNRRAALETSEMISFSGGTSVPVIMEVNGASGNTVGEPKTCAPE